MKTVHAQLNDATAEAMAAWVRRGGGMMVNMKGGAEFEEGGGEAGGGGAGTGRKRRKSSPHSSPRSYSLPRLISGQPHHDRSSTEHVGPKRLRGASFPSTMGSLIYTAHEPKQPQQERGAPPPCNAYNSLISDSSTEKIMSAVYVGSSLSCRPPQPTIRT